MLRCKRALVVAMVGALGCGPSSEWRTLEPIAPPATGFFCVASKPSPGASTCQRTEAGCQHERTTALAMHPDLELETCTASAHAFCHDKGTAHSEYCAPDLSSCESARNLWSDVTSACTKRL